MSASLSEVAAQAGVSVSTASRVFNGSANVSPTVRTRVIEAGKRLRYVPRVRTTSTSPRRLDSVILSICASASAELSNRLSGFYGYLLHAIEEECRENDIKLIFTNCGWDAASVNSLKRMAEGNTGVFLVGPFGDDEIAVARHTGLPVVLMNNASDQPVDAVVFNYYRGAQMAVRHLVAKGHRRIAYLHGQNRYTTRLRLQAYKDGLAEAGIAFDPALVTSCDMVVASAREAVSRLLREGPDFSALMCVNDMSAVGAMQALVEHGRRPGKDVSVVGFDDLDISGYTDIRLTTVHSPIRELCRIALRRLRDRALYPDEPSQRIIIDVALVERDTVRAIG